MLTVFGLASGTIPEAAIPSLVLVFLAAVLAAMAFRGTGSALRGLFSTEPLALGFVVAAVIVALGWFHVVFYSTFPFVTIVGKRGFNYSMSITSIESVIKRHDAKRIYEHFKDDPVLDPLIHALKSKGLLYDK